MLDGREQPSHRNENFHKAGVQRIVDSMHSLHGGHQPPRPRTGVAHESSESSGICWILQIHESMICHLSGCLLNSPETSAIRSTFVIRYYLPESAYENVICYLIEDILTVDLDS